MTHATIKQLIAQGVADALAEYEETRNSGNGNDSHDLGSGKRKERATRECTYSDFLKCQPLKFKGTKEVVDLTYARTWWNSYVKTIGHDVAYGMTWKTLKKMMIDNYTQRFQELALMCGIMFPKEFDEFEKRSVPLLRDRLKTRKKLDNNTSDNNTQQLPFKRQNVARAYSAGSSEKKEYVGSHLTRDCRSPAATNNQRTLTCYEYGNQGHYRKVMPIVKETEPMGNTGGTLSTWNGVCLRRRRTRSRP
ncbi:hypothetical protein Tco_1091220 [Tanacetum coccineum]|uniref:Retrotransposon gag domain-containing protein n=1 Tax=Tanacetum coccineum TaxID=301880 RepID=A0ABQ5I6E4_9ASTR